MQPGDTDDLLRVIAETQARLTKPGADQWVRPYATLGRCFQALGRQDEARAAFQRAATNARAVAVRQQDPKEYLTAAICWRLAGDEAACQIDLAQAADGLAVNPSISQLQTVLHIAFLREHYPAVIQWMAQLAVRAPECAGPALPAYYEHRFAHAYLAGDRQVMQQAVEALEEMILLDQPLVYDTPTLNILDLAAQARAALTRWDAAHP